MTPVSAPVGGPVLDVARVRTDFPILGRQVRGRPLTYLDNAATTQKPQVVIDAISRYYCEYNANVHRGVHLLSELASEAYENARRTIGRYFNAANARQIVFTRNATESINLVAHAFGRSHALSHREAAVEYALQFGRGLDRAKTDRFVGMYVNDLTLSYGERGRRGLERLMGDAYAKGLIPHPVPVVFAA